MIADFSQPSSSKVGEKKERRSGRVSKKARVAYSSDIEELEEQEWQLDVPVKKENEVSIYPFIFSRCSEPLSVMNAGI